MALKRRRIYVNSSYMRARRLYLRKKVKDVARELGVSETAVSRWEHGYMQPSMERLVSISRVYECDVKMLLTETARVVWAHLETVLLEHVMAQSEEMEDGNVPNLDINQFSALAERLGIFAEVEVEEVSQSDAEDQLGKEIR